LAGDWIKLEHATLDKPEIRKTARMLGVKHGEALELYLRWWVWLDVNSVDGLVDGLVDADVDDLMRCQGFSACMRSVGWLSTDVDTGKLRVSGFSTNNGESSKKRALTNRRQSKWRAKVDGSVDARVDGGASQKASTREEKRRVVNPIVPSEPFELFWKTWPINARKVNRKDCVAFWRQENLDGVGAAIAAHVVAMKATEQWREYCPAPLTYLRQRRWEDGAPAAVAPLRTVSL
jgi:hypothetical protein